MAERRDFSDASGKLVMTSIRVKDYLMRYLERRSKETQKKRVDVITETIQDGAYYQVDLSMSVEDLFEKCPEIREKYYERFRGGPSHHSYITEEVLPIQTLAISDFIREAVDEKINAEGKPYGYQVESKEERLERWNFVH